MHRAAGALGVVALALAASGCALLPSPGTGTASGSTATRPAAIARPGSTATGSAIARPRRTHELPTPAPATPPRVDGGWPTPVAAVRAFATTYINWTAATIAARLRRLARVSVGQARAAMAIEAGEVGRDRELRSGGITNAGQVETVAPLTGATGRFVVVTRERTGALRSTAYRGLAPAWHVSVATVSRVGGRWVLSGWQPES